MKGTDKFLIGIVIGVVILIGAAFAVAFMRPEPTFQPEDTPAGVAHNYLLALQKKEYERAYGYLSPTLDGYPDSVETFIDNIDDYGWQIRDLQEGSIMLAVETTDITGERAEVVVQENHFRQGGLFDSSQYDRTFDMRLSFDSDQNAWKIIDSDSYWVSCWENEEFCR